VTTTDGPFWLMDDPSSVGSLLDPTINPPPCTNTRTGRLEVRDGVHMLRKRQSSLCGSYVMVRIDVRFTLEGREQKRKI
jgi:hypothetical protein